MLSPIGGAPASVGAPLSFSGVLELEQECHRGVVESLEILGHARTSAPCIGSSVIRFPDCICSDLLNNRELDQFPPLTDGIPSP